MDKSYIIRVYKQETETESASGIVEDVEGSQRFSFNNANQLWSLITDYTKPSEVDNVVQFKTKLI